MSLFGFGLIAWQLQRMADNIERRSDNYYPRKRRGANYVCYTDKEREAIKTLKMNMGRPKTAVELGISTAILLSIMKKAAKYHMGELQRGSDGVYDIKKGHTLRTVELLDGTKTQKTFLTFELIKN